MAAQVSFMEGTLSLIHIPLDLYPTLLQPILQVLLPPSQLPLTPDNLTITTQHHGGQTHSTFLNISITPIECSIVCHSAWAESIFAPAIRRLSSQQANSVAISGDTYIALSVYGTGMDAGSRVVELTSPLALAGIPIFFTTTYYSDFILVPTKDRQAVVKTLLARNFVFSNDDQSQLVSANPSPTSSATAHRHGGFGFGGVSSGSVYPTSHSRVPSQPTTLTTNDLSTSPTSPPPAGLSSAVKEAAAADDVDALHQRTFDLLRKRHVTPYIEPGLTLVQCSGLRSSGVISLRNPPTPGGTTSHTDTATGITTSGETPISSRRGSARPVPSKPAWVNTIDTKLYTSTITALVSQPRFLSLTLAPDDPPSLLLDRALVPLFGDALVGPVDDDEAALVPIFLDLADLPFEATGIVSGVAGRLVRQMGGPGSRAGRGPGEEAELSYLSTARAGAVMLGRDLVEGALGVLRPLLEGEE
ncbi:ACT domain-containing protein [Dichotomopilus funicola]|uniref:ACT domain-containing protein n=1 Tax=Dichotomopilus funicola TaxID=1934379 RepID=A0AAN6V449_9PEZI|nr:ACT domain-containing protein [Dichotomopilus funicola]